MQQVGKGGRGGEKNSRGAAAPCTSRTYYLGKNLITIFLDKQCFSFILYVLRHVKVFSSWRDFQQSLQRCQSSLLDYDFATEPLYQSHSCQRHVVSTL